MILCCCVTLSPVQSDIKPSWIIGPYEDFITTVRKRKLRWYGHLTRSRGLAKMILHGTVQEGRRTGRQKKRWEDNISELTGLGLVEAFRKAEDREEWRKVVARSSLMHQRSLRLRDEWVSEWVSERVIKMKTPLINHRTGGDKWRKRVKSWSGLSKVCEFTVFIMNSRELDKDSSGFEDKDTKR